MTDLAALVVRLEADASMYLKALDQATKALKKHQKDQESALHELTDKFKEFGAQLAAAFAVEKILEFTKGAIESQAAMADFAMESGVAVQALAAMQIAFVGTGVNADVLEVSIKKLNQAASEAAGDGTSKAALAFKALGVSVLDSNGNIKSADVLLAEISDAYSKTADGPNKVAIQYALMGKASMSMIPALNEGKKSLKDAEQAAIDCGAALSKKAAAAAKELDDKFASLATTSKAQLQNAIAAQLVPALLGMMTAFGDANERGARFQVIATDIVTAIKIVATAGMSVALVFESIGDNLGSLAAQATALAHGKFAEVNSIIADNQAQQLARDQKFDAALKALWSGSAAAQVASAKEGAEGAAAEADKVQLANLAALGKGTEAVKKLEEYANGLKEQAAAFGQGAEAAAKYKMQSGPLGDALKLVAAAQDAANKSTGKTRDAYLEIAEAGMKAANSARAYARAVDMAKDTKTGKDLVNSLVEQIAKLNQSDEAAFKFKITTGDLGEALDRLAKAGHDLRPQLEALKGALIDDGNAKAVQKLNDDIAQTKGQLQAAGGAAFDLQHQLEKQNYTSRNDTAGLAALQARKDQLEVLDQYNELVARSESIEKDAADQEARLNNLRAQGALTDLQFEAQMDAARNKELAQLAQVYAAEKQIADGAGSSIPQITDGVKKLDQQMQTLQATTKSLEKEVNDNLEKSFANNFSDLVLGAKTFQQAVMGFLKDIEKIFVDMIAKNYAQQLFSPDGAAGGTAGMLSKLISGSGSGSGGSSGAGVMSGLSRYFGGGSGAAASSGISIGDLVDGAYATGGTMPAGSFGLVGEHGPEVAYAGSQDMHIQPMSSAKSLSVNNHFVIQSQNGQISRASQMQVAANAARSIGQANRRNNS